MYIKFFKIIKLNQRANKYKSLLVSSFSICVNVYLFIYIYMYFIYMQSLYTNVFKNVQHKHNIICIFDLHKNLNYNICIHMCVFDSFYIYICRLSKHTKAHTRQKDTYKYLYCVSLLYIYLYRENHINKKEKKGIPLIFPHNIYI